VQEAAKTEDQSFITLHFVPLTDRFRCLNPFVRYLEPPHPFFEHHTQHCTRTSFGTSRAVAVALEVGEIVGRRQAPKLFPLSTKTKVPFLWLLPASISGHAASAAPAWKATAAAAAGGLFPLSLSKGRRPGTEVLQGALLSEVKKTAEIWKYLLHLCDFLLYFYVVFVVISRQ